MRDFFNEKSLYHFTTDVKHTMEGRDESCARSFLNASYLSGALGINRASPTDQCRDGDQKFSEEEERAELSFSYTDKEMSTGEYDLEAGENRMDASTGMIFEHEENMDVKSALGEVVHAEEDLKDDMKMEVDKKGNRRNATREKRAGTLLLRSLTASSSTYKSIELEDGENRRPPAMHIFSFLRRSLPSFSCTTSRGSSPLLYSSCSSSGADRVPDADVYEALQSEPICATRIHFRSFSYRQAVTASRQRQRMATGGPSLPSSSVEWEASVGLFIGQLPCSYSQEDVKSVLIAVAIQKGETVQIRSVKFHGAEHTCAFVMINSSALPVLLEFHRRVVCDLNSIWLIDPSKVACIPSMLEGMGYHHFLRCGVPRAALVLERLVPQRKPTHLPLPPPYVSPHYKGPPPLVSSSSATPIASSSLFPTAYANPSLSPFYTTVTAVPFSKKKEGEGGLASSAVLSPTPHALPRPGVSQECVAFSSAATPFTSAPFTRVASSSPCTTFSLAASPGCEGTAMTGWKFISSSVPQQVMMLGTPSPYAVPPSSSDATRGRTVYPPSCGSGPLLAGTPWSSMATATFFFPTGVPAGVSSSTSSSPRDGGNTIWLAVPPASLPPAS